jgi:outer membrane receptor protein involved in Fe transport
MEYGELIADIGLRYEFFIQAREAKDSATLAREGIDMLIIDSHEKWAPRIGFAYPISDKAKLMFNYGHFYQRPGFSKYYQRSTQSSGAYRAFSVIGNANIDFEKTILYEVGVTYAISEGYKLDISGYYKDQYGLLNTIPVSLSRGSTEVQANIDYARARGMEFEFEKRYGQFLSGSIKYEYTFAYGKSSSDRSDYYIRYAAGQISIKENPLDWDIRHTLTFNGSLNVAKGDHPRFGIFKLPDDWNMNVLWQFKTGRPFTPSSSYPGLILRTNESPLTNSKRMPATSSVDLGVDKNFLAYGVNYTLKLQIYNVFNTRNVYDVFTTTGLPNSNRVFNGQISTGLAIDQDPMNYTNGRQIMIGLSVQF